MRAHPIGAPKGRIFYNLVRWHPLMLKTVIPITLPSSPERRKIRFRDGLDFFTHPPISGQSHCFEEVRSGARVGREEEMPVGNPRRSLLS